MAVKLIVAEARLVTFGGSSSGGGKGTGSGGDIGVGGGIGGGGGGGGGGRGHCPFGHPVPPKCPPSN